MHINEKFKFLDNEGKEVEFLSVPYSFDLAENVIEKRFGKETIEEFASTHTLNCNLTLAAVQEDFPKLLLGDLSNVDFRKQSGQYYDEMRKVYYFFLEYDSNASLRLSEQLKETIASSIETMKTTLHLMPDNISAAVNGKNITNN